MSQLVAVPKHVKIGPAWGGLTVFGVVRQAFPDLAPREVFRMARGRELLRNELPCHPLESLVEGDVVTVLLHEPKSVTEKAADRVDETVDTPAGPFQIVREDEDLLVADKPSGCASHPAHKHAGDTLIERIRHHLGVKPGDVFQPALANRLDIETSGIVLVGKNRTAQRRLGRHLQKGLPRKYYLVLVDGWPEPREGEIAMPLVKHPDSRDRSRYAPDHHRRQPKLQSARTRYSTLARMEQPFRATLLQIELLTGRTHQIRRHLVLQGHPVAGDRRYGDRAFNEDLAAIAGLRRLFLHAHRVVMSHPVTGQPLDLRAPLPPELGSCLRALGCPEQVGHLDARGPGKLG